MSAGGRTISVRSLGGGVHAHNDGGRAAGASRYRLVQGRRTTAKRHALIRRRVLRLEHIIFPIPITSSRRLSRVVTKAASRQRHTQFSICPVGGYRKSKARW